MSYNYQDASMESQQEYFGKVRTDNKETLHYALKRIEELEKQIEKMKCGQNCKHLYLYQEDRKCKFTYCDCTNCKDKWEMKE